MKTYRVTIEIGGKKFQAPVKAMSAKEAEAKALKAVKVSSEEVDPDFDAAMDMLKDMMGMFGDKK